MYISNFIFSWCIEKLRCEILMGHSSKFQLIRLNDIVNFPHISCFDDVTRRGKLENAGRLTAKICLEKWSCLALSYNVPAFFMLLKWFF